MLKGLSSNIFDEFACGSDQLFFNLDFASVLNELCNIDSCFDVFVAIEGFAEGRLENVAWVGRALVLKKLCWERPTSVTVNISEVPMESFKVESSYASNDDFVAFF